MSDPTDSRPSAAEQPEQPEQQPEAEVTLVPDSRTAAGTSDTASDADQVPELGRWHVALREIASGNALVAVLSVLLALVVGSLMIVFTDKDVRYGLSYFFARPSDTFYYAWRAVSGAYVALFRGAVYNDIAQDPSARIKPLTDSLLYATPLILSGLGVGLAFRTGLFNIGGRGQMLLGGAAAAWVAVKIDLPIAIHLPLAILIGAAFGALWAGLAGLLKAATGAHEVIVTIMLNYVAFYLVFFVLSKPSLLQSPTSGGNPKSAAMPESATLPPLLGARFGLHWGFVIAILATLVVWWILTYSALGFRLRAVGENPSAARASGISVGGAYVTVMVIAGALVGLAGVNQVLGTVTSGATDDLDAGIGFDAITVALLGRSRPWGVFAAGLLFGAFKAGGSFMQVAQGITVDIVTVIEALIVLFLAAPPLVRAIFRLPSKEASR